MNSSLSVEEILDSHYVPAHIDLADGSVVQLRCAVSLLGQFLGRPAVMPDLMDATVCKFMRWLLSNGRSPRTVNGKRSALITLWRFAFRKGMTEKLPDPAEIPRAKEPRRVPTSWTDEQFAAIIKECDLHQDSEAGKVLKAVLLAAWDTDCRIGAIMSAKRSDFSKARRSLLLYETKTRTEHIHYLSDATIQAILSLPQTTPGLFAWDRKTQELREHLTAILKSLGFPATAKDKFHKVRRTKYTAVYQMHGAHAASMHAGHSTDMSRHYLDTRRLEVGDVTRTLPPPLAG